MIVGALLALTGCYSAKFTKPDMVDSDPGADLAQCQQQAEIAATGRLDRHELTVECMKRKGYSLL